MMLAQCICTLLQALPGVSAADQARAQSRAPQQPHAKAQQDADYAQNKVEAALPPLLWGAHTVMISVRHIFLSNAPRCAYTGGRTLIECTEVKSMRQVAHT